MKDSHAVHTLSDSSARRLLSGVIVSMVAIILGLVLLAIFGMETVSGLRSFVGAEGLWSKSQKGGTIHLVRYAASRDERDYELFRQSLHRPLGDHRARLELEKRSADLNVAHQGFIDGGNHPLDVATMASLFRRFRNFEPIDKAIGVWERGDALIDALGLVGERLHDRIATNGRGSVAGVDVEIEAIIVETLRLDDELTLLEDEFSRSLGEASRWAVGLLTWVMVGAAVIAVTVSIVLFLFVGRLFWRMQIYSEELAAQREVLVRQSDELALRNQMATAQAELDAEMRGDLTLVHLTEKIISYLARYIEAPVGVIFVDDHDSEFVMMANYAGCFSDESDVRFRMGEGLVGQAAENRQSLFLSDVPVDFVNAISGLGEARPRYISLVPCVYNDEVKVVLEFVTFAALSREMVAFLEHASASVAITVNMAQARTRLRESLPASAAPAHGSSYP